jgi:hypothetical protein
MHPALGESYPFNVQMFGQKDQSHADNQWSEIIKGI